MLAAIVQYIDALYIIFLTGETVVLIPHISHSKKSFRGDPVGMLYDASEGRVKRAVNDNEDCQHQNY